MPHRAPSGKGIFSISVQHLEGDWKLLHQQKITSSSSWATLKVALHITGGDIPQSAYGIKIDLATGQQSLELGEARIVLVKAIPRDTKPIDIQP